MHEPAVAITDFVLAAECAAFAFLVARTLAKGSYRMWLLVFFISIAAGALFGGITHAYFPNDTPGAEVIWICTMIAIGITAAACWVLGAEIVQRLWYPLRIVIGISFLVYIGIVAYGWRSYRTVINYYLPASLFLLLCAMTAVLNGRRNHLWTTTGLVLTFAAAFIQVTHVALPPLDHNALYHLVQAVALLLIFIGFVRVSAIHQP